MMQRTPSITILVSLLLALGAGGAVAADRAQGERGRPNRLVNEQSPYLLQHAYNPVRWYPWGDEAISRAKAENKPIFLSIGYSTCHWCHVMERDVFSRQDVADVLDAHFVSIKVDREERPDIDALYMAYVEASTGEGGWPLNVLLTPDLEPFFGGTFFPANDEQGRVGLIPLLIRFAEAWERDHRSIERVASGMMSMLRRMESIEPGSVRDLDDGILAVAVSQFASRFDPQHGGFSRAPKFPQGVVFSFLFRYWAATGDERARTMAQETLRAICRGGIHDHIGGGFHRYSTDDQWTLPHFEKMLYDQAQIAASLLDAYQISRDPEFAEAARGTLEYVLRDLRSSEGGFFSAQDAESLPVADSQRAREGAFYLWTARQLEAVLGKEDVRLFGSHYGLRAEGNFAHQESLPGANVLIQQAHPVDTAARLGMEGKRFSEIIGSSRQKLLRARMQRPRPHLDDKIITGWNGLMISALARGARVLDEPRYLQAAVEAAEMILSDAYDADSGVLQRHAGRGPDGIRGFMEDYAFFIQGLLDLYEASLQISWLDRAVELQRAQDRWLWAGDADRYRSTMSGESDLPLEIRRGSEGEMPSPESITALNLFRLAEITGSEPWRRRALSILDSFSGALSRNPQTMPQMLVAFGVSRTRPHQIIIAGDPQASDTRAMLEVIYKRFMPAKVLLLADGGAGQERLTEWLPFVESMSPREGRATAYVCENFICRMPTSDRDKLEEILEALSAGPKHPAEDGSMTAQPAEPVER